MRGDGEAECVALWRLYHPSSRAGSRDGIPAIMARLSELAGSGEPLAELLVEIESAVELGRQGRRDDALRTIHACERPGRETVLAQTVDLRGGVLLDLGCPEEVGLPTAADDLASGQAGEGTRVVAYATWLRVTSPELAITIGREMAPGIRPVRLTHQQVALSGVVALIAVHAGDLEQAEALIERGEKLVGHIGGGHGANFLRVAEASLAVARHDERRAVGLLEEALAEVPMEVLPARSYLNSLPLLHLLIPEVRPMIDRANLGPALTTVQAMARALTALREDGDPTGAVALPWRRPTLLRVHVAPPHLAELAVAAVIGGVPEAEAVLGESPRSPWPAAVGGVGPRRTGRGAGRPAADDLADPTVPFPARSRSSASCACSETACRWSTRNGSASGCGRCSASCSAIRRRPGKRS